jgi:hypothetical protein
MNEEDEEEASSASDKLSGAETYPNSPHPKHRRPKKSREVRELEALQRKELLTEKILALLTINFKGPTMTTVPPPGNAAAQTQASPLAKDSKSATAPESTAKVGGNVDTYKVDSLKCSKSFW